LEVEAELADCGIMLWKSKETMFKEVPDNEPRSMLWEYSHELIFLAIIRCIVIASKSRGLAGNTSNPFNSHS
jgi:hypothetical protein